MSEPTPGPWMAYGTHRKRDWGVGTKADEIVSGGLSEADARFIATAPDMEDALERVIAGHEIPPQYTNCGCVQCHAIRQVLAKARGEANG